MDHTTTCPHCQNSVDISHEKTLLLRTLLDHGALHRDSYHYLIQELDLPEPSIQQQEKSQETLLQIIELEQKLDPGMDKEKREDIVQELQELDARYKSLTRR